jgi:hypothetical protein
VNAVEGEGWVADFVWNGRVVSVRSDHYLGFILSSCYSVCIVSFLRLVLTHHFAHTSQVTSTSAHHASKTILYLNSTESGTYALLWSTVEVNVAIICAFLLVMKLLIARFVLNMNTEETVSAREDARLWRATTGLGLLGGSVGDEEKAREAGRRDTAISINPGLPILFPASARLRGCW